MPMWLAIVSEQMKRSRPNDCNSGDVIVVYNDENIDVANPGAKRGNTGSLMKRGDGAQYRRRRTISLMKTMLTDDGSRPCVRMVMKMQQQVLQWTQSSPERCDSSLW